MLMCGYELKGSLCQLVHKQDKLSVGEEAETFK